MSIRTGDPAATIDGAKKAVGSVATTRSPRMREVYLSVRQAAQLFPPSGVHPNTIRRYMQRGLLPFYRVGGRVYLRKSEVLSYLASCGVIAPE